MTRAGSSSDSTSAPRAAGLRVRRDGILQVEDDGVRPLERLRVALGPVGGAEQQRGPEVERLIDVTPSRPVAAPHERDPRRRRDDLAVLVAAGVPHRHDPLTRPRRRQSLLDDLGLGVERVAVEQRRGNATSLSPSCATSVPWVSWVTDAPTIVESVHIEFMRRCPNGCVAEYAASRCSACVFIVSDENSTLSASVAVRPGRAGSGRRPRTPRSRARAARSRAAIRIARVTLARRSRRHATPSARAITSSCTSVVPSPISRIFESR